MISIICAILATTVYRLELDNEVPYIVGEDNVRRQVCIVDPEQYMVLTGRLDQVWRSANSTASGRVSLHGKIVNTAIDTTNGTKVVTYKDGYKFTEKFERKTKTAMDKFAGRKTERIRNTRISERQQKMREELEAAKKAKPTEVTVEHNDATGKDTVK